MNSRCPLADEKGVALVVTLAVVSVLVAAALQLARFTGDSVMVTQIERDRFQAEQLAISGINMASLILVDDAQKTMIDSVQEPWADPARLSQAVSELGLQKINLTIKITDELSKIQVNALIRQFPGNQDNPDQMRILENFLTVRALNDKAMERKDPTSIIHCVKDWLDSGDDDAVSGISGAESDYYLGLDPPYSCANGPFNHIQELLQVKGISKDLLKNESFEPADGPGQAIVLDDVFTIYGQDKEKKENNGYGFSGRVNINTAGVDVLAALLPQGMEDLANDLFDYREEKNEQGDMFLNPLDKGWYKKVIELSEKDTDRLDRTIRYSSDVFKVECSARNNNAGILLIAFLRREKHNESGKWSCRILQMERK